MTYTLKSVPTEQFMMRIKEDSMAPRILKGGRVLVEKRDSFENDEIVVAEVNGVAVCRRLQKEDSKLLLVANNSKYAPRPVAEGELVGRVISSQHCLIADCTGPCCNPDTDVLMMP